MGRGSDHVQVFIVGGRDFCMHAYSLDGTPLRKWKLYSDDKVDQINKAIIHYAVAARGNEVVVTDHHDRDVRVFGSDGTLTKMWDVAMLGVPDAVTVTLAGHVAVSIVSTRWPYTYTSSVHVFE